MGKYKRAILGKILVSKGIYRRKKYLDIDGVRETWYMQLLILVRIRYVWQSIK
ncbi:MAG: hypothetical protein H6Q70_4198 [Firmicutes bacterium]|nr:hypothetical protein [Bacillota bacterium]